MTNEMEAANARDFLVFHITVYTPYGKVQLLLLVLEEQTMNMVTNLL